MAHCYRGSIYKWGGEGAMGGGGGDGGRAGYTTTEQDFLHFSFW